MGEKERQTDRDTKTKEAKEGWREGKEAVKELMHSNTEDGQSNSISKDCILETKGSTAIVVHV